MVKSAIGPLRRSRLSPSLWVPVLAPGKWYFEEVKYALRKASIPTAVTQGYTLPRAVDFSKLPGIYNVPCSWTELAEPLPASLLREKALRSLLVLARFTVAYTNEVQGSLLLGEAATTSALKLLAQQGYIEHHPNDGDINAHLLTAKKKPGKRSWRAKKRNGDYWPYWRIRRSGISAALRVWGVPVGRRFDRLERTRLLNSRHRRRSRQWPKWVNLALPHAEIYAGWNEVSIPGLKSRPDALAWGEIHGVETLFWLEVETGNVSRQRLLDNTSVRWMKAKAYAKAANMHLIFVLLSMPWVQDSARIAFTDVPQNCAVIVANWKKLNFGKLPYPKWGEVVVESFS